MADTNEEFDWIHLKIARGKVYDLFIQKIITQEELTTINVRLEKRHQDYCDRLEQEEKSEV